MIKSFINSETEAAFHGNSTPRLPPDIQRRARRKLDWLDQARSVEELRAPPGNRLERLRGDREGQHAIRINDQWRLCFRFRDGHAYDVEIVDYH